MEIEFDRDEIAKAHAASLKENVDEGNRANVTLTTADQSNVMSVNRSVLQPAEDIAEELFPGEEEDEQIPVESKKPAQNEMNPQVSSKLKFLF